MIEGEPDLGGFVAIKESVVPSVMSAVVLCTGRDVATSLVLSLAVANTDPPSLLALQTYIPASSVVKLGIYSTDDLTTASDGRVPRSLLHSNLTASE